MNHNSVAFIVSALMQFPGPTLNSRKILKKNLDMWKPAVIATSGVSRISARGVLKLRPDTKSGGGAIGLAQYKRVSRMCWRRVLKSMRARNFW